MDGNESARPAAAAAPARPRARRKKRAARWSAKREAIFLARLAETANVKGSARACGLSASAVYARRQKHPGFRGLWVAALCEGYARLEANLLDRALNGVEKPVWHGGKQVGTATEYSDRLALSLLSAHRQTVIGAPAPLTLGMSDDQIREEVLGRLATMRERLSSD